ncbi:MAG: histidine kinase [Actinomycetia bacterium]|nr:histidine kinase [Actinomycetes bacterium]
MTSATECTPTQTASGHPDANHPWATWGWLMWIVWLVFLIFPGYDVWQRTAEAPLQRTLGIGIIVVFAITYVLGAWRLMLSEQPPRSALAVLGLLLALAAVSTPLIGPSAVSFTPFLVSFAAFALARPWHWVFFGAVLAITLLTLALTGHIASFGPFMFILLSVGFAVNLARQLTDQSQDYEDVQQDLAVTAERERVARDVHDVLGHSLTAVSVKAGLAERLIDVDPQRAKAEIAEVARIARESLTEVRATVGGLRAAQLATELDSVADTLASAGVEAVIDGAAGDVDPAHRSILGWVLREAVTNVVRHARATRCEVTLGPHTLVVEDDGMGIGNRRVGNGLRGLRERVELGGGSFGVGPGRDGRGTRLEASWPS